MHNPPNPWGTCFDAAAHNLVANLGAPGLRVCHGVCVANKEGQEGWDIAHAWLEFDHNGARVALECIHLVFVDAAKLRASMKARDVVEYEPSEFLKLWRSRNFPGPWDETVKRYTSEALSLAAR